MKKQHGGDNALVGIIVIILITLVGGVYFLNTNKSVLTKSPEKAATSTTSSNSDANFSDQIFMSDDAGEGNFIQSNVDVQVLNEKLNNTASATASNN